MRLIVMSGTGCLTLVDCSFNQLPNMDYAPPQEMVKQSHFHHEEIIYTYETHTHQDGTSGLPSTGSGQQYMLIASHTQPALFQSVNVPA